MRGKLDGRYTAFVQASEKESLLAGLQEAEDWLYSEEGEDATKSAYVQKLDALKGTGDPIVLRWKESEERPKAAAQLREEINTYLTMAQSGDEKYSHISDEDKNKVVSTSEQRWTMVADPSAQIEKCATTQQWLDDRMARQAEKPKNVNPVITSAEMLKRRDEVVYTCAAIMNRPRPKPKVTESQPGSGTQTPAQDQSKKEEKMDVEEGGPSIEEMDVD
jgi:heat shock protein 4